MSKKSKKKIYYRTETLFFPSGSEQIESCLSKEVCSPKDIVAHLDKNVIGQERAKKTLAVAAYNHFRRINNSESQISIPKSNILLQGMTGSGKTFLLKNLASFLNIPLVICDASIITEAAYKGKNVETILADLYYAADKDIAKAEKGIIFLDEFDKLSNGMGSINSSGAGVGVGVQRQMLKMIEGCVMTVPIAKGTDIRINTENILFICGGAFVGIKGEEGQVTEKHLIGFRRQESKPQEKRRLTHQDFVDYGLIPEIVGRLPVIVELDALTEEDLVNILLISESSVIKSYQNALKSNDVELIFETDAITEIAHIAHSKNTGARGLNAIIEDIMEDIMYEIPSDSLIYRCTITKQAVRGEDVPIIERRGESSEKFLNEI